MDQYTQMIEMLETYYLMVLAKGSVYSTEIQELCQGRIARLNQPPNETAYIRLIGWSEQHTGQVPAATLKAQLQAFLLVSNAPKTFGISIREGYWRLYDPRNWFSLQQLEDEECWSTSGTYLSYSPQQGLVEVSFKRLAYSLALSIPMHLFKQRVEWVQMIEAHLQRDAPRDLLTKVKKHYEHVVRFQRYYQSPY